MAEYIEREAALYRAKSFLANHIDGIVAEHAQLPYETCNATEFARGYERGAIDAVKVVLATPAADVEVVRHGWWVDRYGGKYANPLYECSECKEAALKKANLTVLDNWITAQVLSAHCPNCGAHMNEEVKI